MRIIAGRFKRRTIKAPKGMQTRPTSDKLREALFSILGPEACTNARVLDLFAGTGALGLEAMSRGAASAVFVEQNRKTAAIIRDNIAALGIAEACRVICQDATKSLRFLSGTPPFDLVFLDPPYGKGMVLSALTHLASSGALYSETRVVVEYTAEDALPEADTIYRIDAVRSYGKTLVAFLSIVL